MIPSIMQGHFLSLGLSSNTHCDICWHILVDRLLEMHSPYDDTLAMLHIYNLFITETEVYIA
jgi:hypothetical protein